MWGGAMEICVVVIGVEEYSTIIGEVEGSLLSQLGFHNNQTGPLLPNVQIYSGISTILHHSMFQFHALSCYV